ncbi:MAG TPA: GH3 auxin-responsive promoter family protein [Candidatus Saccharimonadales bacterium]|nr:GH3 auxin-responsive promoter family protein [Candidatus Saccharimonadales bacterium]
MHFRAAIANALWQASNLPAYRRYKRGLRNPGQVQRVKLHAYLQRNSHTAFGKAHNFAKLSTWQEFKKAVPARDHAEFIPWLDQIRAGEQNVLSHERITHLIPTSGSTGPRKLIPFTAGLQREFDAGIAGWMLDLSLRTPGLAGGPAYWSITPALKGAESESSAVPIGFESDTAYLGGAKKHLVDALMAVPAWVQTAENMEAFRYVTLLFLLRCPELRLISVWHPSYLSLLLDAAVRNWEDLLADIRDGRCRHASAFPKAFRSSAAGKPAPKLASKLARSGPDRPQKFWPNLKVVSCWADGAAALGADTLRKLLANTLVQAKGLLATEAFVTLPFGEQLPLAINSHFFEFIDGHGNVHLADGLQHGEEYEIVVTTAGGLWRYRLRDRVRVTGFLEKTPSLQFLGRTGNTSDRFGEKLSETFVTEVMREIFMACNISPRFALLAPDEDTLGCRYTLYIEVGRTEALADAMERALGKNPHYAYCRELGQLLPLEVFTIHERGYEAFVRHQGKQGKRLGEVKPATLSPQSGWSTIFAGAYVTRDRATASCLEASR